MIDIPKYEKALRKRLAYIDKHMHTIEDQLDDEPNKDWEDNAVEREGDEVLEDLGNMDQSEARAINAALARIKDGTYGECVKCGEDISKARLDLLPHTPFCKEHAPG
jgi:RNA polymerase-binding transcription factor DksA